MPNSKKRFVIGIDAGVKSGFAVWDREKKKIILNKTTDFWGIYYEVCGGKPFEYKTSDTMFVIENPALNKPVFQNRLFGQNSLQSLKIAQNVGSNKREAELLIRAFRQLGFQVVEAQPTTAKWTAEHLERLTGITERTSAHVRDAIKLVFGL